MSDPFKLAFTAIVVVITVLICVVLQVILSRKPNKLWGWLLPTVFFVVSFFIGFSRLIFRLGGPGGIIGGDFYLFFLANVPTVIMLSIYFPIRHRAAGKGEGMLLALKNDQEEEKDKIR